MGQGKATFRAVRLPLALANSRGMRAERRSDLINSAMVRQGKASKRMGWRFLWCFGGGLGFVFGFVYVFFFFFVLWLFVFLVPPCASISPTGNSRPGRKKVLMFQPKGPGSQAGQQKWSVTRRPLSAPPGAHYSKQLQRRRSGLATCSGAGPSPARHARDPRAANVVMQGEFDPQSSDGVRDRRGPDDEPSPVSPCSISPHRQTRSKLDEVQMIAQERLATSLRQELLRQPARNWSANCAKAAPNQGAAVSATRTGASAPGARLRAGRPAACRPDQPPTSPRTSGKRWINSAVAAAQRPWSLCGPKSPSKRCRPK